jgi:simple sugar transport system permease protein
MIRLEPRRQPSPILFWLTPLLAVALTLLAGMLLFEILRQPPLEAMRLIFIAPVTSTRGLAELLVKATPLTLIAIGLAVGFRGGIWNIGAEGQFAMGALSGGAVALAVHPATGWWLLPLMSLAGIAGGALWAAIPALLRTRFNTNEILVSLMLVYVALLLLSALVHGPLRDPEGLNFPESRQFQTALPIMIAGTRAHVGFLVALLAVALSWLLMQRHVLGFQLNVLGQSARAARFGGFSQRRLIWTAFLLSGGCAGLAGLFEAAGPVGQLVPALPAGYGFTAIIVAFLGRLHPLGILLAALVIALTYIGGETAQIALSVPSATTSVFQGMFLFFLLATDVLVGYRPRRISKVAPAEVARADPARPIAEPAPLPSLEH